MTIAIICIQKGNRVGLFPDKYLVFASENAILADPQHLPLLLSQEGSEVYHCACALFFKSSYKNASLVQRGRS